MTFTGPPSAFLVHDAFATADDLRNDSPAATPPVHVEATGQFGSSASFTATQAGNRIVWSGSAATADPNRRSVDAAGSVLLKYAAARATKLTVTVEPGWVTATPAPNGSAEIGGEVQTAHGRAVAHFEQIAGIVTDNRLTGTVQVAAGATVFILLEGSARSGGSGSGLGVTVTLEDVP
ncbi:MAG TPA: hypothetical protein VFO94_02335 [Gammaproteobacteria bacterium]|nr:hypothetical protein [Gammaproteobacteria bacterium]